MSEEKKIYIYNKNKAPVIVHIRDDKGKILETIIFPNERNDSITGRVVTTGYTPLTEEKYKALCETSRTFKHYKDVLKLLTAQDDLPPEAKAPHEALADARRGEREALAKAAGLEAEIVGLKAKLLDAETKYKTLESASTGEEKLKPLKDRIAEFKVTYDKILALAENFTGSLEKMKIKDDAVQASIKAFRESFRELVRGIFE
jgi:hypothetical protein